MTQTDIRPMTSGDLGVVLEMVEAIAAHHNDPCALTPETLQRDAFGWYHMILAWSGDRPVGYAALLPTGQLQFGVRGIDIHHLFVCDGQRGQGVGKALIEASLNHATAQGCAYVTVGTDPDNHAAQAAYEACGFERRGGGGVRFSLRV